MPHSAESIFSVRLFPTVNFINCYEVGKITYVSCFTYFNKSRKNGVLTPRYAKKNWIQIRLRIQSMRIPKHWRSADQIFQAEVPVLN
jgi:hypothetical protein